MAVLTAEKEELSIGEGGMSARESRTVLPVWLEAKQWYSGKEIASKHETRSGKKESDVAGIKRRTLYACAKGQDK